MTGDDNHDANHPKTSNPLSPIPPPTSQIPHTVSSIKLPILKKREYDIWAMNLEHYLCHTDYPIWQVIQNGNGPVFVTTNTSGMIKVLPPKTNEEVVARERERKAMITLLMALPEDHLAKFHKMADAKEMWEAIKSRFGGNDESKKIVEIDAGYSRNKARDNAIQVLTMRLLNTQMSANDKIGLGYGDYRYGSILSYENEVLQSLFVNKESDLEDTPVNDRYADGMHAVPLPMTWNYMSSGPDVEIDYSKFTYGPKQTSIDESNSKPSEYASCESESSVETTTSMPAPVENAPKVVCELKVWNDASIIEEYESDSDDDSVSNVQEEKEKPSFAFTDTVKHVKTSRENVKETSTSNHSPTIKKQDRNGHTRKGLGYAFTRKACFVCVKTVNDEVTVQALIDGKKVTIKESSIRQTLRLDDEEGTSCLANDDIFTRLANMGYEKMSDKLTFYKATMASAIICLATNQKFNFFSQDDVSIPTKPSTSKPHKKYKSKKQQPKAPMVTSPKPSREHQLPSPSNDPIPTAKDSLTLQELMDLCTRLSNKVLNLESEVIDNKSSFTARIQKLKDRVDQLEEENRALKEKSFKTTQVDTAAPVEDMEKSFKQGRMIADMDKDVEDIDEEVPVEVEEVLEVVKVAKLMTETKDKGKGILIEEPKSLKGQAQIDMDDVFARQLEAELNANINWNDVIEQVKRSEKQDNAVMRFQALKRKPMSEAQARKNMMIYLKNMAGFKIDFFKGMTYSVQAFLKNEEEEKQKMDEEAEKLKRHLQIVASDDDDVFTKATPLASKVPVVDYQIHYENNKPYYKIIKTDGTHKLFLSFITLLKNFDREDLEALWKLIKESESEGILDDMCDVPFSDKNHFDAESDRIISLLTRDTSIVYSPKIDSFLEEFVGELVYIDPIPSGIDETDYDPKDDIRFIEQLSYDDTSSEDDSLEDIDYVEASPPDSELVSLEEMKDEILHAKLLNIHLLIAKIESLNNNPTPDCVLKSPSSSFLSYTDNSSPEFENFSYHTKETSSGSTTTHAITLFLSIENVDYDSEGDILFLEELLRNDSFPFLSLNHLILIFLMIHHLLDL
nr:ribonuclease H-like domain-containing protein [Tanacetum cinerariifolium]